MTARLFVRINFEPQGNMIGPGMVELMERIEGHGSIRKAAVSMDMSYQKAWLLIDNVQQIFGGAIFTTEIGGRHGGGTGLTELGRELIQTFRNVQKKIDKANAADVRMLSELVREGIKGNRIRKGLGGAIGRPEGWRHVYPPKRGRPSCRKTEGGKS